MTTSIDHEEVILIEPVTLLRRRQKKNRRRKESTVYALIMASHVRGLECWHALIRGTEMPFKTKCVLHVDSHPDMMLPRGPFPFDNPRALYDNLQGSMGGIAEWLLPAFALGHCETLVWLRAKWCDQIRDGLHEFKIGTHKEDKSLRVSCTESYFSDDLTTYSPECDLENIRVVHLLVASVNSVKNVLTFFAENDVGNDWLLDVCLDYFAVRNPFLDQAIRLLGEERGRMLHYAFLNVRYRGTMERQRTLQGGIMSTEEREAKLQFEAFVSSYLGTGYEKVSTTRAREHFDRQPDFDNLIAVLDFAKSLPNQSAVVKSVLELLESPGLPHHPEVDHEQQMAFYDLLASLLPPKSCIIARSDEDEYTPLDVTSRLEDELLEAMIKAWPLLHIEALSVEVPLKSTKSD